MAEVTAIVTDHRPAALAAMGPIANKLCSIYAGANNMDQDAWRLIEVASDKAQELVESYSEDVDHAGRMVGTLKGIAAQMRGAELLLEALGDDRTVEDEGALTILKRHLVTVRDLCVALDRQSLAERESLRAA